MTFKAIKKYQTLSEKSHLDPLQPKVNGALTEISLIKQQQQLSVKAHWLQLNGYHQSSANDVVVGKWHVG